MENKVIEIDLVKQGLPDLFSYMEQASKSHERLDKVEMHIFKSMMDLGMQMLQFYIRTVKQSEENSFRDNHPGEAQNKGLFKRTYFSLFGKTEITRSKFYFPSREQTLHPLDKTLGLPKGEYSYALQDWIGLSATETDFRSSVALVNRIFGHGISAMQSERMANELSGSVDEFYEEKEVGDKEEGECFAVGFDDKGIPIRASDTDRDVDSNGVRLGKGQKKGVKKSSTVSVSYSFDRFIRNPGDIVSSLFKGPVPGKDGVGPTEPKQWAQNKHIRAFLSDKEKAIKYGFEDVLKRSGETTKEIVVLIDGDRGLEKAVDRVMASKGINVAAIVLDFIHVTEYVWKAANAYFGEKSTKRLDWVKQQCLLLLKSKLGEVVENLQGLIEKSKDRPTKQETIQKTINYFLNHEHMMDYQSCLDRGFPISTGAVESACGHFVQNRMERNGMRWSLKGAQNMLDLRAANKNEDWDGYLKHHIEKEQETKYHKCKMAA
jgi:hypothetical protein